MAFNDAPIIDKASINSEKSEICVSQILNQGSGFLCRRDVPDKGCDLDIELILNGNETLPWRFPVQIKSVEKLVKIKKNSFISFAFETSRLGYLNRRIPSSGYVILYSVKDEICYYESVSNIIDKLLEEKEDDSWKLNEDVNIHIPASNILNAESAKDIHALMSTLFTNATLMQNTWGRHYNLPSVKFDDKSEYDLRHPDNIVKFLSKYGILLLNKYDINFLYDLLGRLPLKEIVNSKDLLYIATITYCEVGKINEAAFYLKKCVRRKTEFSDETYEVIQFYNQKILFALGEIGTSEFIVYLKESSNLDQGEHNAILFKINSIYFQLLTFKALEKIPTSVYFDIMEVFDKINVSGIDESIKWRLRIWNCGNYSHYSKNEMDSNVTEVKIREELGEIISLDEKKSKVLSALAAQKFVTNLLQEAKSFGDLNKDELISAYASKAFVENEISTQIGYISHSRVSSTISGEPDHFQILMKLGIAASEIFVNNNLLKEAYFSLCHVIEVLAIANKHYHLNLDLPVKGDILINNIKYLELELELEPYQPVVENLLTQIARNEKKKEEPGMQYVANLNSEQIETVATLSLRGFGLPIERLPNIINELNAYKLFYNRNKNQNLVVLQFTNLEKARKQFYNEPISFIIKDMVTGIETISSVNMEHLLNSLGM